MTQGCSLPLAVRKQVASSQQRTLIDSSKNALTGKMTTRMMNRIPMIVCTDVKSKPNITPPKKGTENVETRSTTAARGTIITNNHEPPEKTGPLLNEVKAHGISTKYKAPNGHETVKSLGAVCLPAHEATNCPAVKGVATCTDGELNPHKFTEH